MTEFADAVYAVVAKIPAGSVLSYKQVAERAGRPRAYRAVGAVLRMNKNKSIPCHRVIMSSGKIGGYNGLRGVKKQLLVKENAL